MEQHYPKQWKNRMTTGESIAAELRFQIVNSTLEPDTLLTENQVAKQFDVSRSPVRDAFKLLQTNQLIHLERMGARVLEFGEQEKKELYDLRSVSYTHLTLPTIALLCRSRWSPYH